MGAGRRHGNRLQLSGEDWTCITWYILTDGGVYEGRSLLTVCVCVCVVLQSLESALCWFRVSGDINSWVFNISSVSHSDLLSWTDTLLTR